MFMTRYGHSFFYFETNQNKKYVIDPVFEYNPCLPDEVKTVEFARGLDAIFLSHGHFDHTNGVKEFKEYNPDLLIVAPYEVALTLKKQGYKKIHPLNYSGQIVFDDLTASLVPAMHSSSFNDDNDEPIQYAGGAAGYVFDFKDDRTIYFSGDTGMFTDMKLIQDYYQPDTAMLCCGGRFTMGPKEVAYVVKNLLNVKTVIPHHTWPTLERALKPDMLIKLGELFPATYELLNDKDYEVEQLLKDYEPVEVMVVDYATRIELPPIK